MKLKDSKFIQHISVTCFWASPISTAGGTKFLKSHTIISKYAFLIHRQNNFLTTLNSQKFKYVNELYPLLFFAYCLLVHKSP